jgi:hypothetical protein
MYRLRDFAEPLTREALRHAREWPRTGDGGQRPHILSAEYKRLRHLLSRYCRGEVDGISVLLTGQRGAGKTTLAKLAVEAAMWDSRHLIPLPVYLHGPTVIDPSARSKPGDDPDAGKPNEAQHGVTSIAAVFSPTSPAQANDIPSRGVAASTRMTDGAAGGSEQHGSDAGETTAADAKTKMQAQIKEGALRVILTELYHCLSRALHEAWLNAIGESPDARRRRHELLEPRAISMLPWIVPRTSRRCDPCGNCRVSPTAEWPST